MIVIPRFVCSERVPATLIAKESILCLSFEALSIRFFSFRIAVIITSVNCWSMNGTCSMADVSVIFSSLGAPFKPYSIQLLV